MYMKLMKMVPLEYICTEDFNSIVNLLGEPTSAKIFVCNLELAFVSSKDKPFKSASGVVNLYDPKLDFLKNIYETQLENKKKLDHYKKFTKSKNNTEYSIQEISWTTSDENLFPKIKYDETINHNFQPNTISLVDIKLMPYEMSLKYSGNKNLHETYLVKSLIDLVSKIDCPKFKLKTQIDY